MSMPIPMTTAITTISTTPCHLAPIAICTAIQRWCTTILTCQICITCINTAPKTFDRQRFLSIKYVEVWLSSPANHTHLKIEKK